MKITQNNHPFFSQFVAPLAPVSLTHSSFHKFRHSMSISSISLTKISSNSLFHSLSPHNHNWDNECRRIGSIKIQSHKIRNLLLLFYSNLKIERTSICWTQHHFVSHSIDGGDSTAHDLSNPESYPADPEGSVKSTDGQQEKPLSTTKILEQLKRYGVSGVLSYGLLNTAYYLTTFLLVWFYFAPAPGNMGYLAAVSRFLKVMAMVWAGSQVTKLIRAGGALALAPLVDRGLSWFTVRYKFQSRGKAFFTIVAFCLSLAVIMFLVVTLVWA